MSSEAKLKEKIGRIFRVQEMQAEGGKTRFGDWNTRLKDALLDLLGEAVLEGTKQALNVAGELTSSALGTASLSIDSSGLDPTSIYPLLDDLANRAASKAEARAHETSHNINDTTGKWLREERSTSQVFGEDRLERIAVTELAWCRSQGYSLAADVLNKKLRWVTHPGAICPSCLRIQGKIVKYGTPFVTVDGEPYYHPPLHPNCFCKLEIV